MKSERGTRGESPETEMPREARPLRWRTGGSKPRRAEAPEARNDAGAERDADEASATNEQGGRPIRSQVT